jgi:hypothetical protein
MKDRIKVLAFLSIKNPSNPFPETGNVGDIHCLDDEELKKFVSLIIADCATLCKSMSADYFKLQKETSDFGEKNIYAEGRAAAEILQYKMRQHFGV